MTTREFRFSEGSSDKFWRVCVDGSSHTVTFGRAGTAGQTQTKQFASDGEATRSAEKLVAEKLRKGYVEVGAESAHAASAGTGSAPSTGGAPAKSAAADKPADKPAASRATESTDSTTKPAAVSATGSTAAHAAAAASATSTAGSAPSGTVTPMSAASPRSGSVAAGAETVPDEGPAERSIALDPDDWRWATWRRVPARVRPAPPAFDRELALRRLAKIKATYWWKWEWEKAGISDFPSREEATFWFVAMSRSRTHLEKPKNASEIEPASVAAKLADEDLSGFVIDAAAVHAVVEKHHIPPPELFKIVASLLDPADLVEAFARGDEAMRRAATRTYYVSPYAGVDDAIRLHVLPFLSEAEADALRDRVRPLLDPSALATLHQYQSAPVPYRVAAILGMDAEIRPVVEGWPDDEYAVDYKQHYQQPERLVFGLGDAASVQAHMRRLGLRLKTTDYARAWLAHTEYGGLDWLRDSVLALTTKDEAAAIANVFALVSAPEAAPHMLDLMLGSKAPKIAREWLDARPRMAAEGLALTAAGARGKVADAAADYMRGLGRRGHDALVRAAIDALPADAGARARGAVLDADGPALPPFDDATTPAWLRDALADPALARAKTPTWVLFEDLPSVTAGERAFGKAQTEALLRGLQSAKPALKPGATASSNAGAKPPELPNAVPAIVRAVKANADAASVERFAWALFERWLADGAPSKEGWAMRALGLLGGDASVLRLAPMIRVWPGESQHQRAVNGLDVLRAIGTDTALMQINGIAQKVSFKGIKTRAAECLDEIASERGLTRAELEDRIVPDCGLDERGSRVFDFGPRSFEFLLGADMKPMVREAGGKPRPDLPKPGAKDDAALAAAAVAEWKLLKKQVAEVAKIQAARLERSMVTGRRWSRGEFETLLVGHPLMRHLARMIVWGAYGEDGALGATFRVTEDDTYADARDETFDLEPYARVGIVHPLALAPETRAAWGELFADYEIVPPFPQLGRPVHALEGDEPAAKKIERFKGPAIPAQSLVFTLEKLGWERGAPGDGGVFFEHVKPFYGAGVTAVVTYEGVPVGYMEGWDDQHLESCLFLPGIYTPITYARHDAALTLGDVDPVAVSEVLADLTLVASKGK